VLGEEFLMDSPGASLADLLVFSGEADVSRKGEAQADLSLQASSFEQTGLFLDGFPVNDSQTGHFNLDVLLPAESLSSVEISPIPWGSRGLAGSVNLVPRRPAAAQASLSGSVGSFHTARSSVRLGLPGICLWGGLSKSDGDRPDTDSLLRNIGTLFETKDVLHSRVFFSYSNRRFGANDFYGQYLKYDEWEATETYVATCRGTWQGSWGRLEPGFFWRQHKDHFVLDRYGRSAYSNRHTTDRGGLDSRWSKGRFRGALTVQGEALDSASLGTRERGTLGCSGSWEGPLGTAGLEWVAVGKGLFEVSPLLTASAHAGKRASLNVSLSRAFRQASFTELYYTDPQNKGDAGLSTENAWNLRVAPRWDAGPWSVEADGFLRAERHLIDWVRVDASQPWCSRNIGEATARGAGGKVSWKTSHLRLQAGYDFLEREADLGGLLSKYALQYPRHKGTLRGWGDWKRFSCSMGWSRFNRTDRQLYTLLEGKAAFKTAHGSLYVSVANALDVDYQEVGGVPMPGRSFDGGIEWSF